MQSTPNPDTASAAVSAPILSEEVSVSSLGPLSDTLSSLCREYRRLSLEIEERTREALGDRPEALKSLKEEIESIALSIPSKKVLGPAGSGWYTIRKQATSTEINPNKLAEKGVGIEIIEYATEKKKGKEYVEVRELKADEKKSGAGNINGSVDIGVFAV